MTDRINAFVVVLKNDVREDDAAAILTAIRMVKGVITVEPHVSEIGDAVAAARVGREIRERIWNALEES